MLDGFYGAAVIEEYKYRVISNSRVTAEIELQGFIVSATDFSSSDHKETYYGPDRSKLRVSIDFDSDTYAPTADEIKYLQVPADRMGYLNIRQNLDSGGNNTAEAHIKISMRTSEFSTLMILRREIIIISPVFCYQEKNGRQERVIEQPRHGGIHCWISRIQFSGQHRESEIDVAVFRQANLI
jgi:hypothetical protein